MTLLDRLTGAGIPAHVAARYARYGRVRVDGTVTTDPLAPIWPSAVVEIQARPRTWQTPEAQAS